MKLSIETGKKNHILRAISTPVKPSEIKGYESIVKEMIKYVKNPENNSAGLAAPQIGINKRFIAVWLIHDRGSETYKTIAMFNPEIIEHSDEEYMDTEWCLSIPREFDDVKRWEWIKVQYLDLSGVRQTLKLNLFAGRIVQHEIDHLDGVLFTDRVEEKKAVFF